MHELSLVEAMTRQIEEVMAREGAERLHSVTVVIGALSGVDRDAFEFAYPLVAVEGSPLEGAKLIVEERAAEVSCGDCRKRSNPEPPLMTCGVCGSANVEIVGGREFQIKAMEIE